LQSVYMELQSVCQELQSVCQELGDGDGRQRVTVTGLTAMPQSVIVLSLTAMP
jgi:hypothetical protein